MMTFKDMKEDALAEGNKPEFRHLEVMEQLQVILNRLEELKKKVEEVQKADQSKTEQINHLNSIIAERTEN